MNGLLGTPCKALRTLFVDKRYINALFNLIDHNQALDLQKFFNLVVGKIMYMRSFIIVYIKAHFYVGEIFSQCVSYHIYLA